MGARFRQRGTTKAVVYAVLLGQLALSSCSHDTTYHGPASGSLIAGFVESFNLGEKVFTIVRVQLTNDPQTPQAQLDALDARRDDFIRAVNAIIQPQDVQGLGPTLAAVLRLVDDDTLPEMADYLADILEIALNEPDLKTLKAVVALSEGKRTIVQTDDILEFAARVVRYPEVARVFETFSDVLRQNDGVDDQGVPNGEPNLFRDLLVVIHQGLLQASVPPAPGGTAGPSLDEVVDDLLKPAQVRGQAPFGNPAWVVLADGHGNPRVLESQVTGQLFAPFVDLDQDGDADVDGDGDPVDASGQKIVLPAFGIPGAPGRDADGRLIATNGELVYEYVDAKETLLSFYLQAVGDALRRGVHLQIVDLLDVALGARVPNDAGTPGDPSDDYLGFDPSGPVADLTWGAIETAKHPNVPATLRALAHLVRSEPVAIEDLMVDVGKILERLRPILLAPHTGTPTPPSAASRMTTDRALSLLDRVFATPASTGPSTGRVLIEVLQRLGTVSRAMPSQLAMMARYSKLQVDAFGHPAASSRAVDWSQPPTIGTNGQVENRSSLHQLLALLSNADACPIFGTPLAEILIDLMAGVNVSLVGSLIELLQNGLVRSLVVAICPGIGPDLDSLEALRASGALNAFLPIAEVFADRGETRLLIDLLKLLHQEYDTLVRPNEPTLADVLDSGAFEGVFDVLDVLVVGRNGVPVADPVTGERAIDLFIDALGEMLRHPAGGVRDRLGRSVPSKLHLIVEPLRDIEDRMYQAGSAPDILTALVYNLTDLLIERVTNQNGTPNDPSDDYEELANPAVAPFTARLLEVAADGLPPTQAERIQRLNDAQQEVADALSSRDLAVIADLMTTLRHAPATDPLRDAVVTLLTPQPLAQDDVFGSLLKVIVSGIQTRVDVAPLRDFAAYLARVFDPNEQRVIDLTYGVSRFLAADRGRVVLNLIGNALNDAPAAAGLTPGSSPVEVLVDVAREVGDAAGTSQTPTDSLARMQSEIADVVAFIRDPDGLQRIFSLIRSR